MVHNAYTFRVDMNWQLINAISKIDRFDASWSSIEKKEGRTLKQLKTIATIRSVGASTRIEGSTMSDADVERLIENLNVSTLNERDEQEVAGYFTTLDLIAESFNEISITGTSIKSLHKNLMQFTIEDEWHRGNYKQHSNSVQAQTPEGKSYTIFETTPPGIATEDAMQNLIDWYQDEKEIHSLVKAALFCYDFVSIHPFQDGNGRMSRLLSTLLLLKSGYKWIQYVSFEHEIENRKGDYYRRLMECQKNRPGENVTSWVIFFFECLMQIQNLLLSKLDSAAIILSQREKSILVFIENNPGSSSGKIAKALHTPLPTIKKALGNLLIQQLIEKDGVGPGTNYRAV